MEESKWGTSRSLLRKTDCLKPLSLRQRTLLSVGTKRIRACIELGIKGEIEVRREFKDDDAILTCLIETTSNSEGSIGGSVIKMSRRIQALERCYGIKHGNNGWGGQEIISAHKTQDQLAADFNMSCQEICAIIRISADLPVSFRTWWTAERLRQRRRPNSSLV